jgi:hypothetical protein
VRPTFPLLLALLAAAATPAAAGQLAPAVFDRFETTLPPPLLATALTRAPPDPLRLPADTGARRSAADASDTGRLAFAGLLGGAAGLVAGALIGDRLQGTPCEDCYLAGFAGAVVGKSLGIPLAVHLADGRRGQPAPGMVASLAIAAAGLVAAGQLHRAEVLLVVPVVQLVAAVASERHTANGTAGRSPK